MRRVRHVENNLATSEAGALQEELMRELDSHRWDRRPTNWSQ